jgi:hypothetical protein
MTVAQLRDRLLRRIGQGAMKDDIRMVTNAILDGLQRVGKERAWHHYRVTRRIITTKPYSTGTVAVDHLGTTVTLSGGTLPASLDGALLQIDGDQVPYPIASRTNDTTFELENSYNASDDSNVSGATFKIYFYRYDLPSGQRMVESVRRLSNGDAGALLPIFEPEMESYRLGGYYSSNSPDCYSVRTAGDVLQIDLYPYPLDSDTLIVTGVREPNAFDTTDGVADDASTALDVPSWLERLLEAAALVEMSTVVRELRPDAVAMWEQEYLKAVARDAQSAPVSSFDTRNMRQRRYVLMENLLDS